MYRFEELLGKWKIGDLTAEQAVGQLLQHLQAVYERLTAVEKRLHELSTAEPEGEPKKSARKRTKVKGKAKPALKPKSL